MAFLLKLPESYGVCVGENLFLVSDKAAQVEETVPLLEKTEGEKSTEEGNLPECVEVTCCTVNDSHNSFAICTNTKQLVVKSVVFWATILQRKIEKQATTVRFVVDSNTQERSILVADRAGNVYQHSFDPDVPAKLLLGHYSIIMDLIFTADPDLVITCDRDEKIRVSRYPDAYQIERYLLGHTEYVRSLGFIDIAGQKRLISVSGKSVKVWDYLKDSNRPLYTLATSIGDIEMAPRKLVVSPLLPLACVSYERNDTVKLIRFQTNESGEISASVANRNLGSGQPGEESLGEIKDLHFTADGRLVALMIESASCFIDVYQLVGENELQLDQVDTVSLSDSVFQAIKSSKDDLPSLVAKSVGFNNVEDYKRRKQERIDETQKKRLKC